MPIGILGILAILAFAVLLSEHRLKIKIRIVVSTLALQAGLAALALLTPFGQVALKGLAAGVNGIIAYTKEGIGFIFGPLANVETAGGLILAVQVLPVIIFVSSLVSILYHFGIMQLVVKGFGGLLRIMLGLPRIEAVCASANVFVGMVEAPLTISPYLPHLTRAQLFSVMCTGLSTVSGAILVGYASLGINLDYLITAAFMGAPGGLLMAKILLPESDVPYDPADRIEVGGFGEAAPSVNFIEAAANGALAGLRITASVAGMLLAFVALVALANGIVGGIGAFAGFDGLSLEMILGYIFAPVCFLIGIPWDEAIASGNFLGQKIILNEFLAYANFAPVKGEYSAATQAILTVALCGFANLSAMAILLGGLGSMIEARRGEIAELGIKTVLAGTLANLMSAAIVGVVISVSGIALVAG